MTTINIGSREAHQKWRDLLDAAQAGSTDTVIERNGKPVAVLIPYRDYLELREALEDLRAARRAAQTYEAWKQNPARARAFKDILAEIEAEETIND